MARSVSPPLTIHGDSSDSIGAHPQSFSASADPTMTHLSDHSDHGHDVQRSDDQPNFATSVHDVQDERDRYLQSATEDLGHDGSQLHLPPDSDIGEQFRAEEPNIAAALDRPALTQQRDQQRIGIGDAQIQNHDGAESRDSRSDHSVQLPSQTFTARQIVFDGQDDTLIKRVPVPVKKYKKIKKLVRRPRVVQQSAMPPDPQSVEQCFNTHQVDNAVEQESQGHDSHNRGQYQQSRPNPQPYPSYHADVDHNYQGTVPSHPPATLHQMSDASSFDIGVYAQSFVRQIERKHRADLSRLQDSTHNLEFELHSARHAHSLLQDQCDALQREKQDLGAEVKKKQAAIVKFEAEAARFKTYVDGLGNDINSLRREASTQRLRSGELTERIHNRQDTLLDQLTAGADKSRQLKDEALQLCRELKSELDVLTVRLTHLQQEVNEKSRLLAQEKDLRTQLQTRTTAADESRNALLSEIKSTKDDVLKKTSEILGTVQNADGQQAVAEMFEKTMSAVQILNTGQSSFAEDLMSVKGLVHSLSERVRFYDDSRDDHQINQSVKTLVDEALNKLRNDLDNHDKLVAEHSASRETISGLRERLQSTDLRIVEIKAQLESSQSVEDRLRQENQSLEASVARLQAGKILAERLQVDIGELKTELQSKTACLEAVETDLATKDEELAKVQASHDELSVQYSCLQQTRDSASRNTNVPNESVDALVESARIDERTKAVKESKTLHESQEAKWKNDLKAMEKARDKAMADLRPLRQELDEAKAQLARSQSSAATALDVQAKLGTAVKTAEDRRKSIASLEAKVDKLRKQIDAAVPPEDYNMKCNQLNEQHDKIESLAIELQELRQKEERKKLATTTLQEKLRSFEKIGSDPNALREQLCRLHQERDKALNEKDEQAEQHKRAVKQLEDLRQKDISETKAHLESQHKSKIEELQRFISAKEDQICTKDQTIQEKVQVYQDFATEVNSSWEQEQQRHQRELAAVQENLAQVTAERNDVLAANDRLRIMRASDSVPPQDMSQQKRSTDTTVRIESLAGSQLSSQLPRSSQRAVDRNAPAAPVRGPIVDELQQALLERDCGSFDGISSPASFVVEQRGPIVDESQQNAAMISQPSSQTPSSSHSNTFKSQTQQQADSRHKSAGPSFAAFHAGKSCMPELPIDRTHDVAIPQDPSRKFNSLFQDNGSRKRNTSPNIGSKRVNSTDSAPPLVRALRQELTPLRPTPDAQDQAHFRTPEPQASPGPRIHSQIMILPSSSPDFVTKAQAMRSSQTYGFGSAKKRSNFRNTPQPLQEQAASASKRKLGQIENGYEHERKKRLTRPFGGVDQTTRSITRFASQPDAVSGQMLPPSSSQSSIGRGPATQPRIRSLAGASKPQTRSKTSAAKGRANEMNARFAYELGKETL